MQKVLRNDLKKAQVAFKKNEQQKAQAALEDILKRISNPEKGRWSKGSPALKQLLDELFAVCLCWLNTLHTRRTVCMYVDPFPNMKWSKCMISVQCSLDLEIIDHVAYTGESL